MNCKRIVVTESVLFNYKCFSNRQLPNEARLFAQVDKSWKDIMRRTIDKPNALKASTAAGKKNNRSLDTTDRAEKRLRMSRNCAGETETIELLLRGQFSASVQG